MGVLQDAFEESIAELTSKSNVVKGVLKRVLKRRGIDLTEAQLEAAAPQVERVPEGSEQVTVSLGVGPEDQSVQLDDAELESALDEYTTDVGAMVEDVLPKVVKEISPGVLESLYADLPKALRHRRTQQRGFEKRLHQRWRDGLDRLEMLIMIAHEGGEMYLADLREVHADDDDAVSNEQATLIDALVRIHARSCRVASEVLCLLKAGFADGANARWRTLHENAVIAMFLSENGGEVANRYLRHSAVERFRASKSYEEHCEALGYERLTADELAQVRSEYEDALREFGSDFKNEYGWAARALGLPSPRFADIEKRLDMNRWRPFVKMACHSVHAGPHGLFFSLADATGDNDTLIAGASNAGLCDPGDSTAISLTMVSAAAFTAKSNVDGLVTLTVMQQLCGDIGDAFLTAHQQLLHEIEHEEPGQ